ncbi:MAG: thioredoxin family protein [Candidatus Thermoplasmatota archaeon]|jgi:thiol-disulfide isomerase/thioredoxin|nr:thioredoxin family protein [Candidatus Thermoplasmatota archaeon]MDP7265523.1 thioredoxin family protein [Candidatus Thermoplasmatota archaeon]
MEIQPEKAGDASKRRLPQLILATVTLALMISGIALGGYGYNEEISIPKCLSCLGLTPVSNVEFRFQTANGADHPDWILDEMEEKVVFIDFSLKYGCVACDEMLPVIEDIESEYEDEVEFFLAYWGEDDEMYRAWGIYDFLNGELHEAPTFIIITLNKDSDGVVKPFYGEIVGKTPKNELVGHIEYALEMHRQANLYKLTNVDA